MSKNETTLESSLPAATSVERVNDAARLSLRMWPGLALIIVMWLCRLGPGLLDEVPMPLMMAQFMGPPLVSALILLWWLFFSRAKVVEKIIGLLGIVALLFVANSLADKSVKGFLMLLWGLPWGMTGFVGMLFFMRSVASQRRVLLGLLAAAIGIGFWDLVRADVIRGDFETTRNWRWVPSPEEVTLTRLRKLEVERARARESAGEGQVPYSDEVSSRGELADRKIDQTVGGLTLSNPGWPEFRGPNRDGRVPGVRLRENWGASPPHEVWRIPVGPAWSSFTVAGERIFTAEQRDQDEVVVCYDARTGSELWAHEYPSRFGKSWEVPGRGLRRP